MKLLLLCLGLTLVCAHHEENHDVVTSNFDISKISGEWYTILLASGVKEKIEENRSMRKFVKYIEALDNSSLLITCYDKWSGREPAPQYLMGTTPLTLFHGINGECTEITFVCDETEEKGVYSVYYDGYNTFHITEGVYDDYLIFYDLNSKGGENTQVLSLQARNPHVSPQLKERFEELCQSHGIPKENVLDVSNANPCFQA